MQKNKSKMTFQPINRHRPSNPKRKTPPQAQAALRRKKIRRRSRRKRRRRNPLMVAAVTMIVVVKRRKTIKKMRTLQRSIPSLHRSQHNHRTQRAKRTPQRNNQLQLKEMMTRPTTHRRMSRLSGVIRKQRRTPHLLQMME